MAVLSKMSKVRAQMLLTHPFFATLMMRMPLLTPGVDEYPHRAATDGANIIIRQDMIDACTVAELKTIYCHEISHVVLMHLTRVGSRQMDRFNRAADYAINLMLKELDLLTDIGHLPGGWLFDYQYEGMSTEEIYRKLEEDEKDQRTDPSQDPSDNPTGRQPARDQMHGDLQPKPMSEEQRHAIEQKTTQNIAAAAGIARMQGKLSGSLARMVGDVLEPEATWFEHLRQFMTLPMQEHDDWARRNRRYRGFYLPTLSGKRLGDIVIIWDTSGSMTEDDMRIVCSEVQGIEHQVQPQSIRVIWCDAKVQGEQVFQPGEFSFDALRPVGGGGTDMCVGLDHAAQYDPLICVLATDGYTPWPDEDPDFPLITLCWTDVDCPIGEVVRVRG